MNGYHILDFPLINDPPEATIQFLPHGTRVLKVRMTNPDDLPGVFVLRSEHLPPGFGESCAYSHEDGGTDFRLSWGGGHEQGACLLGADRMITAGPHHIKLPFEECQPLPTGQEAWVYLSLHHMAGPHDQPRTLTLTVQRAAPAARDHPPGRQSPDRGLPHQRNAAPHVRPVRPHRRPGR